MCIQFIEQVNQIRDLVFISLVNISRLWQYAAHCLSDLVRQATTLRSCRSVPLRKSVVIPGPQNFLYTRIHSFLLGRVSICIGATNIRLLVFLAWLHGGHMHARHMTLVHLDVIVNLLVMYVIEVERQCIIMDLRSGSEGPWSFTLSKPLL